MRQATSTGWRRRERWLGQWLAALVFCVWPAAIWHEATTAHVICPEHGEVLDVAEWGEGDSGHTHVEPNHREGPTVGEQEVDDSEHGACPFTALGQPSASASPFRPLGLLMPEAGVRAPLVGATVAGSVGILFLAPKQSPPA